MPLLPYKDPEKQKAKRKERYQNNRTEHLAANKASPLYNPQYKREIFLQKRYGISTSQYNELVTAQDSLCAICRKLDSKLFVDHDHETKIIRGLLCTNCNLLLGHGKDSVLILESAISYLKKGS